MNKRKYANRPAGIDVSHHNGKIDWAKVKAAGISFVFLKATEGATYKDPTYDDNYAQAKAHGIAVGAYHFFRPGVSTKSQVDNFVAAIKKLNPGDLPPVLDAENPVLWEGLSAKTAADKCVAFMDAVKSQLGATPVLYAGSFFIRDQLGGDARLAAYPLWLAQYRKNDPAVPKPYATWTFWQHTESGTCPGITGNCDMNVFNGTLEQLAKLTIPTPAKAGEGVAPRSKKPRRKA